MSLDQTEYLKIKIKNKSMKQEAKKLKLPLLAVHRLSEGYHSLITLPEARQSSEKDGCCSGQQGNQG